MESLSPVVLFLVSFPEASLVAILGLSIFGIKPKLSQVLFIGFIQAILGDLTRLLPIPFGFHTLLQFVTFSAVIYFAVAIPFGLSFLVSLLGLIIYGVVEAIIAPLLFSITGLSFAAVFNNSWYRVAFFTPEAIVLVVLILLALKFSDKFTKFRELIVKPESNKRLISNTSFPLVGLLFAQSFLMVVLYLSSYIAVSEDSRVFSSGFFGFSALYISVIVVLAILMLVSIRRTFALIQKETKTRAELDSLRRVEELVNTIRAQRHDFTNHLQVAYGLLEVGAHDEAKEYIGKNVSEIKRSLNLVKTDNVGVTALLFTKTGLAEAKSIDFNINIDSNLNPLPMGTRDINTILGNLIDNAFEAVSNLPVDKRYVEVNVVKNTNLLVIDVINSGQPIDKTLIHSIFDPDVSTKGEGRGMGLYSVRKIIETYKGTVSAASDSDKVTFTVQIPFKN